ncbi:hypothetical protein LPJ77_002845 [Coemansia sp. RSA 2523]|nr:hypothetical protein LPJ54_002397 [Coemansia sp. RSA 1824]KAJ1807699.1 hypothetical protein LPJ77_002845 [Coemansia sp. RSA 2523]
MFAPFSSFSRPPIPDFNQDFVNGPIWADALHRMHYVERDGLGELQQQVHQQLGEQWRMLQQLSQWVQDSSSQLCLLAMSLQAPSSFPSFPSSFSSSGSSTTVHPDESPPHMRSVHQMRPVNQTNQMGHVNLMNQGNLMSQPNQQSPTHHMRQPVRFNPQTSPTSAQSAPYAPNQTIALRARVAEAAAAAKATGGLSELDELPPNKKRGAALPIREILKAAEPVRHLDISTESVCQLDVLPEPVHHLNTPTEPVRQLNVLPEPVRQLNIPTEPVHQLNIPTEPVRQLNVLPEPVMQGRNQPCAEESSSQYRAERNEQHVLEISTVSESGKQNMPVESSKVHVALEPQPIASRPPTAPAQATNIPTPPPLPPLGDLSATRPAVQHNVHEQRQTKDKDAEHSTNSKHKFGVASATCPACSGLQQRAAQDSSPAPGSAKSVLQLARMFDQTGIKK